MYGKGELPINKLGGFSPPSDYEHNYISKRFAKSLKKSTTSTWIWTIISVLFVVMYIFVLVNIGFNNQQTTFCLIAIAVFVITAATGFYKIFYVNKRIKQIIEAKTYTLRKVQVHHIMPGFGTSLGKKTAKINDEKGNVYFYEFELGKEVKRKYKKNEYEWFCVLKLDEKKELYTLIYIEDENKKEEGQSIE